MTADINDPGNPEPISRPSFSPIFIIILGIIIFFLGPVVGKLLALVLLVLLVAFVLWQAFSRGQYEGMKKSYPDMERSFWIINNLVYHLVIPGAFFAALYCYFRFMA